MFFLLCGNWKTLVFTKAYRYSEGFSNRNVPAFFQRTFSKEVRFLRYFHNNSTTVMPKFKIKIYTSEIFLTNLLFFDCVLWLYHTFLYQWLFLINSESLWKNIFHVSKLDFYSTIIMFWQIEIVFIKWEQIHREPDGTYINNDYINVVIL